MRPRAWLLPIALLAGAGLAACGGGQTFPPPSPSEDPAQVTWNLEPGGLRYRLAASPDLNLDDGHPLGLTVCVYQLADLEKFQDMASSAEGVDRLLDCSAEVAGARTARRHFLQPGEERLVTTDRAEKARYLAVAAGYSHRQADMCSAIQPFPVSRGSRGVIFRTTVYSAAPLDAIIHCTESAVTITGVNREQ